jgi:hypothetical protein
MDAVNLIDSANLAQALDFPFFLHVSHRPNFPVTVWKIENWPDTEWLFFLTDDFADGVCKISSNVDWTDTARSLLDNSNCATVGCTFTPSSFLLVHLDFRDAVSEIR